MELLSRVSSSFARQNMGKEEFFYNTISSDIVLCNMYEDSGKRGLSNQDRTGNVFFIVQQQRRDRRMRRKGGEKEAAYCP